MVFDGVIKDIPLHIPYPVLFWLGIGLGFLERLLAGLPGIGQLLRANLIVEIERPE